MSFKRCVIPVVVIALFLFVLSACENRVDSAHKRITDEKVRADLIKKTITFGEGDGYVIEEPLSVELIDVRVEDQENLATADVSVKALELSSQEGVKGRLRLLYEYSSGMWSLRDLEVDSYEKLVEPYAKRLTELVDYPLHFAANIGDIGLVKKALRNKVPVNAPEKVKQSSALMFASERGNLEIVKLLVANGADVNHSNRNRLTALHAAAYGNHLDIAKLLIDQGANVLGEDINGETPISFAARNDAIDVVRYLVANGVDVNVTGESGRPPIFAAAKSNSLEVGKFLIAQGAELSFEEYGRIYSPLLSAAYYNSVEMVELLLEEGAETSASLSGIHRGSKHYSALELAEKQGYGAVVDLLKKSGVE